MWICVFITDQPYKTIKYLFSGNDRQFKIGTVGKKKKKKKRTSRTIWAEFQIIPKLWL
jgi:hypothetical protein